MTDKTHSPRLAVLIDAENISASITDGLFEEVAKIGDAIIRRIYGNFSDAQTKSWVEVLARHGFVAQQQFPTATGKNASDIALVIDAMDLLYSGGLDVFCIVSSDSDFTPLALRLRESGLKVFGFGRQAASESYRNACYKFIPTDNFGKPPIAPAQPTIAPVSKPTAPAIQPAAKTMASTKKATASKPAPAAQSKQLPSAAISILKKAIATLDVEDGWVDLAVLGSKLNGGLKPSHYGFAKLSTLIQKTDAFEISKLASGGIRVRSRELPALEAKQE